MPVVCFFPNTLLERLSNDPSRCGPEGNVIPNFEENIAEAKKNEVRRREKNEAAKRALKRKAEKSHAVETAAKCTNKD